MQISKLKIGEHQLRRQLKLGSKIIYQRGNQKSVLNLLKAGANFGTTNDFGQSCISQIDPEILETFLNNQCIKVDSRKNHIDDKDFKLIFDYR